MTRTLLLGPGYYDGEAEPRALEDRRRLAACLEGRNVVIMEDEPDEGTDAEKFVALAKAADEIVVWIPGEGRMPTVYAELVALRFDEDQHGKRIVVLTRMTSWTLRARSSASTATRARSPTCWTCLPLRHADVPVRDVERAGGLGAAVCGGASGAHWGAMTRRLGRSGATRRNGPAAI